MRFKRISLIIPLVIVTILILLSACDKRVVEVPNYTIQNLKASPDSIYADNNDATTSAIKATVVDGNGDLVVGETVTFKNNNGSLCSVTASAVTGTNGIATATFDDLGVLGTANIEASIAGSKKDVNVKIVAIPDFMIQNLVAIPDSIYADNDDATNSLIKATVVDNNGDLVVGETVTFKNNNNSLGSITATAVTGNNGVAVASFSDLGIIGTANIEASIDSSKVDIDVRIVSVPEPDTYHIEWMTVNPDTIYADNNITFSTVRVMVKDEDNFAVTNERVTFRTNIGSIISSVDTDSSGIAQTTFYDSGDQGPALIEAFVQGVFSFSANVQINEIPPIESLVLNINSNEYNIDQVALIRAQAQYSYGPVPNGTIIVMEASEGYFQSDLEGTSLGSIVLAETANGVAETYWNAGTTSGVATISAVISDQFVSRDIVINPGSPVNMSLHPSSTEVAAASDDIVEIGAFVRDTHQNPVLSGVQVEFETTLGTIDQFAATNDSGWCFVEYSPGITSGSAQISAQADSAQASTVITVTSDDVSDLDFDFNGQVDIQVGGQSYELRVSLYDVNGNLIDYPEEVWFKFISGPDGVKLNDEIILPQDLGDSLSVEASNGHAVVSVSSGLNSGTVALKAYAFNDNGEEISDTKTEIVVHAGPPNSVDISHDDFNEGVDIGAGRWQIEVAALLTDMFGNPVDHGTAVFFSLPEDPSWAAIQAHAYCGNENADSDSTDGIAYTYLNYEGTHTNEEVVIIVESGNFADTTAITLPIQNPSIDTQAQPAHIDWDQDNNPPDDQSTQIVVTVVDGQNNPIANQNVHFSANLGDPEDGNFVGMTDEDGFLYKDWEFHRYECPDCNNGVPGTTTATVTVQLLGMNVQSNVTIFLTRYCEDISLNQ